MSHVCPICGTSLAPQSRYPRDVCAACARRARSADGRPLTFANEGFDGGYVATYADTGEPYNSHDCWNNGVACQVDEARFGGIVIEAK